MYACHKERETSAIKLRARTPQIGQAPLDGGCKDVYATTYQFAGIGHVAARCLALLVALDTTARPSKGEKLASRLPVVVQATGRLLLDKCHTPR